ALGGVGGGGGAGPGAVRGGTRSPILGRAGERRGRGVRGRRRLGDRACGRRRGRRVVHVRAGHHDLEGRAHVAGGHLVGGPRRAADVRAVVARRIAAPPLVRVGDGGRAAPGAGVRGERLPVLDRPRDRRKGGDGGRRADLVRDQRHHTGDEHVERAGEVDRGARRSGRKEAAHVHDVGVEPALVDGVG